MAAQPSAPACALVVQQTARVPRAVPAYLRLLLNYLYGLEVVTASRPVEASAVAAERGAGLRAVFIILDEEVANRNSLAALSRRGQLPLVLLMPPDLAARHQALATGMANLRVCGWDQTAGRSPSSLQDLVAGLFAAHGIDRLRVRPDGLSREEFQEALRARVSHVGTLPTLPAIVVRLLRMMRDPATTAEDLETVVLADPAIVHRLLRVVNSPAFAGAREGAGWSLKEAIVRLGHRQVGAIAQQVKLVNSLLRPEGSQFELRRFWEHSIGCACIADVLYRRRLLPLRTEIDFDLYWLAALLHDIGRLALGFLAWEHYAEVLERTRGRDATFAQAEERLGHEVTHGYLGRLLLLNSGVGENLATVAETHDRPGPSPAPLVCLVHVADAMTRAIGLGLADDERPVYGPSVVSTFGLNRDRLAQIQVEVGPETADRVRELVAFCLQE